MKLTRLSATDANFLELDSPTTRQHIASCFPLRSLPDLEQLKQKIENALDSYPRLKQKLTQKPYFAWEDDQSFNISHHLKITHCSAARDYDDLIAETAEIFYQPFDYNHPLWDMQLLIGDESANPRPVAFVYRVHHALADGIGALDFFFSICDKSNSSKVKKKTRTQVSSENTRPPEILKNYRIIRSLFRALSESFSKKAQGPLNGPNSDKRAVSALTLPLADVNELKRRFHCSSNDVFLTLVSYAVTCYYSRYSKTASTEARALVPFSLRKVEAWDRLGNHLTGIAIPLAIGLSDIKQKLGVINERTGLIKRDGSYGAYALISSMVNRLPSKIRRWALRAAARRTTFICTNIPTSRTPLYLAGAEILANYAYPALMHGHGLAFAFISYGKQVCCSVVSDPSIVKEPQIIADEIRRGFEILCKESQSRRYDQSA